MNELERGARMMIHELRYLREENQRLRSVADTVEVFKRALLGQPASQGMGEDPIWMVEKALEEARLRVANPAPTVAASDTEQPADAAPRNANRQLEIPPVG